MKPYLIRAHERMTFKRCPRKWYWAWRKGYVPRASSFGALELGTWAHIAWENWYGTGYTRNGSLADHVWSAAEESIALAQANKAPEHVIDTAWEFAALGKHMMGAYEKHYGSDPTIDVIGAEIPLEFSLGEQMIHILKPDMLFRYRGENRHEYWLMENKTASSLSGRTAHLKIDDQARPYGAMAELALKNAGILGKADTIAGITYNYARKALPDLRNVNEQGEALNKNGTVSARQPAPMFARQKLTMTRQQKAITLHRILAESRVLKDTTKGLRIGFIQFDDLPLTPHHSCPRFCQFFALCEAVESGADISNMERTMYRRENPYDYAESTDEPASFELG